MSAVAVAELAKLRVLKSEFVKSSTGGRHNCDRSKEWAALSLEFKFAVMLMAGIDGDMEALTRRAWREMPVPEREAIRATLRGFDAAMKASRALCMRWGDE